MSLERRFYTSWPTAIVNGASGPDLGAVVITHPEGFKNNHATGNLQIRLESSKFADLPAGYIQV